MKEETGLPVKVYYIYAAQGIVLRATKTVIDMGFNVFQ